MLKLVRRLAAFRVSTDWTPYTLTKPVTVNGVELIGLVMRRREGGEIVYRAPPEASATICPLCDADMDPGAETCPECVLRVW